MNLTSFKLPTKEPFKGVYSCNGWNGGKLAYLLGCSVKFPYGNDDHKNSWTHSKNRESKLPRPINLGCKKKYIEKDSLNYNSQFTQDKVAVFKVFDTHNIPHPKVLNPQDILEGNVPEYFLGRKNNSSRGRGIIKYNRATWLEKRTKSKYWPPETDFYVEFLEFKSEHRIHIFQGQIVCEMNKVVKPDCKTFIHTSEQGSPLALGYIKHPKRHLMHEYCIKAIFACGLDFGAVDIFVDKNDNVHILEVNSDPGMPDAIGFLYADKINALFNRPLLRNYRVLDDAKVERIADNFFPKPKKS